MGWQALVSRHNIQRKWNYFPSSRCLKARHYFVLKATVLMTDMFLINFGRNTPTPLNVFCNHRSTYSQSLGTHSRPCLNWLRQRFDNKKVSCMWCLLYSRRSVCLKVSHHDIVFSFRLPLNISKYDSCSHISTKISVFSICLVPLDYFLMEEGMNKHLEERNYITFRWLICFSIFLVGF